MPRRFSLCSLILLGVAALLANAAVLADQPDPQQKDAAQKKLEADQKAAQKKLIADQKAAAKKLEAEQKALAKKLEADQKALAKKLDAEKKKAAKELENAVKQQANLNEAHVLHEAYVLMAVANHTYDGHRGKAMGHVEAAFKSLDKKILAKGTAGQKAVTLAEGDAAYRARVVSKYVPAVHEGQAQSDEQMRAAARLLLQLRPVVIANNHKGVLTHLDDAVAQINFILLERSKQIAKQQVNLGEAHMLREAYVLMLAANHNYEGYRGKAINQVEAAFKSLDRKVKAKGNDAQKIITLIEDDAAARARIIARHVPAVHEGQAQSDAQMRAAAALLLQIRPVVAAGLQAGVLERIDDALLYIDQALKVR